MKLISKVHSKDENKKNNIDFLLTIHCNSNDMTCINSTFFAKLARTYKQACIDTLYQPLFWGRIINMSGYSCFNDSTKSEVFH